MRVPLDDAVAVAVATIDCGCGHGRSRGGGHSHSNGHGGDQNGECGRGLGRSSGRGCDVRRALIVDVAVIDTVAAATATTVTGSGRSQDRGYCRGDMRCSG